jgi:hypothetical protein
VNLTPDGAEWTGEREVRRLAVEFRCWQPDEAARMFLMVAKNLGVHDQ